MPTETRMEDGEAIRRLKRGEMGGLETLVSRYQVKAVRTAYLVTTTRPWPRTWSRQRTPWCCCPCAASEQPLNQPQHPFAPGYAVRHAGLSAELLPMGKVPLEVADQGGPVGVLWAEA